VKRATIFANIVAIVLLVMTFWAPDSHNGFARELDDIFTPAEVDKTLKFYGFTVIFP
jgi:hypothetical protein